MTKTRLGYRWHLRVLMANRDMFATTDLTPLLAERGISLSATQVYRLVTGVPERLSLPTLMALCDILECTPNDLIEAVTETVEVKATGTGDAVAGLKGRRPRRADITEP